METTVVALALLTGVVVGALFRSLGIPVPAPPNLAGIMGIVGIYLGFTLVEHFDVGFDLLGALGLG